MRIVIALIFGLLTAHATVRGQVCRVCQPTSINGGGHHVTEPGQHPVPPGNGGARPHCIWTWDDNIAPPSLTSSAQSTGRFGTPPFAQAVADVAGAVISADVQACTVNTRVTASDTDVGLLGFYIEDTTMGCVCHTIPSIQGNVTYRGMASMRLNRQVSPNSYLTLQANQLWASTSGLSMSPHLNIQQTPIAMQSGNANGGIHVGPVGGTIGGGGFAYVLDPPPVIQFGMDNAVGAAPGARRDDGSVIASVVAQAGLFFGSTPPAAGAAPSVAEATVDNYVANWIYQFHCPVCGTSGTAALHWTD